MPICKFCDFSIIISCTAVFIHNYYCKKLHLRSPITNTPMTCCISDSYSRFFTRKHPRTSTRAYPAPPRGACLTVYSHRHFSIIIIYLSPSFFLPLHLSVLSFSFSQFLTRSHNIIRAYTQIWFLEVAAISLRSTSLLLIIHVYTYYKRVRIDTRVRVFVINICIYVRN